jgi:hypothetical protein
MTFTLRLAFPAAVAQLCVRRMPADSDIVNDQPTRPQQRRFSLGFWIVVGIIVMFGVMLLSSRTGHIDTVRRIDVETAQICTALELYKAEFGAFPVGDSAAVLRSLRGQNPRQIVFFQCRAESVSPDGGLLDPWGTPYKVYFSGDQALVRSAGPNKQFDDSSKKDFDDYIR